MTTADPVESPGSGACGHHQSGEIMKAPDKRWSAHCADGPSRRRRPPRTTRPRPARSGDLATRPGPVRRARWERQDDHARGAGGLAGRWRADPAWRSPSSRSTSGRPRSSRRASMPRSSPSVSAPGRFASGRSTRSGGRCSRRPACPSTRSSTGTGSCASSSRPRRPRIAAASTSRSRASSWTCGSRRTRSLAIPLRDRSRARSSPTSARSPRAGAWTSTTSSSGRCACCRRTSGPCPGGAPAASSSSSTRRRTSIAPSWSSRCCWRHPPTACSSWVTTTRRSTAGGSRTCGACSASRPPCPASAGSTSRRTTGARGRSSPGRSGSWSTTGSGSRSASSPDRPRPDGWSWHPDAADDLVRVARAMGTWPRDESTRAVLARTNRELLVAVIAAVELGLPFRAPDLPLPIEDPRVDDLLDRTAQVLHSACPSSRRSAGPGAVRAEHEAAVAAGGASRPRRLGRADAPRPRDRPARLGGRPVRISRRSARRWLRVAPGSPHCGATTRR